MDMEDATPAQVRSDASRSRARPVLVFSFASALLLALAASVKVDDASPSVSAGSNRPELMIARLDRMPRSDDARARLELLDPTPLFMPRGELADGIVPAQPGSRPGGRVGELFSPAILFPESGAGREVLAPSGPKTVFDGLDSVTRARWFDGLAHSALAPSEPVSPVRAARVEIYRDGDSIPLAGLDIGSFAAALPAGWRPVELSLLVNEAGAVARPLITTGSGSDEMDERLRQTVTTDVMRKVRLRPGIYRIWVGP
jgi:hypothetical protein